MTLIKIDQHDSIVKNVESAAILAADKEAFRKHMLRRNKQKNLEEKVISLEERVAELEKIIRQLNTLQNND